jgi:DNA-3-methyladenine glycosylase II
VSDTSLAAVLSVQKLTISISDLATHIIYQQIHGNAAESIRKRFIRSFGCPEDQVELPNAIAWFPTPEMVLAKPIPDLRACGLSQRKAEYIVDLATHFVEKKILPSEFKEMTDDEISKCLCSVRGIGQVSELDSATAIILPSCLTCSG